MAQTHTVEKLLSILKGSDFNATTKALQYLLSNINQARQNEIVTCVENLVRSPDISVRFWAKKLANGIGKYEAEQTNVQISAISKDLPIDILIQKLHSVASTYLSLDVIKKLCESRKPEALDFLKTYLSSCKDHIQTSYLTKNIGIFFPSEETLLFLVPFLKHNDDRVVANTIEGIEAINSPKGVVVLSQLLEHKSNRVRTNAALALGKFDSNTSFAVILKMLEPESGTHFRISACHAIKTLKEPKFLEFLELALHDDLTFTCALEAISAIGGQAAITMLTDNYSEFSSEKQAKIDSVAIKLSKLEESSLGKFGEKIITSKACAKANVAIEEYGEKIHGKIKKFTDTIMQFCRAIAVPTILISTILVITYFWPEKPIQQPASTSAEKSTNATPIEAFHTEPKTVSHHTNSNNDQVPYIKKNEKQASVQSRNSLEQPARRKESIVQISASQRPERNVSIETFEPDNSVQDRYSNSSLPSTTEDNMVSPVPRQVAYRRTQQQRTSPPHENSISRQEQFQTNRKPSATISSSLRTSAESLPNVKECLNVFFETDGMFDSGKYSSEQQQAIFNQRYKGKFFVVDGEVYDVSTRGGYHLQIKVSGSHYFNVFTSNSFDMAKYTKGQEVKFKGRWKVFGTGILIPHEIQDAEDISDNVEASELSQAINANNFEYEQMADSPTIAFSGQKNEVLTSSIGWEEFNDTFFSPSQSSLKKTKMWKKLKNSGVTWKGKVVEIREESFNSAAILIKMNHDTLTCDVKLHLESNQMDKAAELDKGQEIQFYGVLSELGGLLLPTELKKGKILD